MVHKSELLPALNCGEIAEGGGCLMVVVILPSDVIVLVLVDSVTIGSAAKALTDPTSKQNATIIFRSSM